jgi:hypothetical protein
MNREARVFVGLAVAVAVALAACGSGSEGKGGGGASTSATDAGGTGTGGPATGGKDGGGTGGDATGGGGSGGAPQAACPDIGLDPSAGTIHYVCDCRTGATAGCQPGDDANPGDSASAPWRSLGKARAAFSALSPGDSIAFCRGGAFTIDAGAGTSWVNAKCQATRPCVVRDYPPPWASGTAARPILHALGGSDAFVLSDGGDADHEEGYTFLNLDVRGSGSGNGFFFYNDIDDVLICNAAIDGFGIGVLVEGSNPPSPGGDGANERITLRSSTVTNNADQGWLGACDGCAVELSTFKNNGFAQAVFNHNIYFDGATTTAALGMRAVGNDLYQSAVVSGTCQGGSLVVHGRHDGLLIEGNTVHEDVGAVGEGCWGISVNTGYGSEAESFRNVVIRDNTVVNMGNVGIGVNACDTCLIENNVVIHEQAFDTTGIAVPELDRASDDLPMTSVTVRNNSVLIGAASGGTGISLGGEGTGHVAVSNVVRYLGTKNSWACFDYDLAPSAYAAVGHNLCYHAAAPGAEWARGHGALAAWQGSSGLDAASLLADPGFTSIAAPSWDLRPASASSPLVGAGDPGRSSPEDHSGMARDAQPDIGAYER